jgi:ligand-binding sensor domain-containing protein
MTFSFQAVGMFGCIALEGFILHPFFSKRIDKWWIIGIACLGLLLGFLTLLPLIPERLIPTQELGLPSFPPEVLSQILLKEISNGSTYPSAVSLILWFLSITMIVALAGLASAVVFSMIKAYTPWSSRITRWAVLMSVILLAASLGYANVTRVSEWGGVSHYFDGAWTTFIAGKSGLIGKDMRVIWGDGQGTVWVGTDVGVSRYDGMDWQTFTIENMGLASSLAVEGQSLLWGGNAVSAIWGDGQGTVWVGTNVGVSRYDGTDWQTFTTENMGLASSLAVEGQSLLWGGNAVSAIWGDGQGTVWVGTNVGVSRYDGTDWQTFTTENMGPASDLVAEGQGLLGRGVNAVTAIWGNGQGTVWVGTDGGVSRYDGTDWSLFTVENSGLASHYVQAIWGDGQGTVWVGTNGGVSRYDGTDWQTFTTENSGLASNYVQAIWGDGQGTVWVGTLLGGASRYDGATWTNFTALNSGLIADNVMSLFVERDGTLWAGTWEWTWSFQSPWPALLLAMLAFGGTPIVAFRRYLQLPDTRAERIYKRGVVESPAGLYAQIYSVWSQENEPKAVLCHLSEKMRQSDSEDVADMIDAFCTLAAEPGDLTEPLEQAASILTEGELYNWGREMLGLYRLFSAAYQADCITNLTALDLAVTANPLDDTHRVRSRLGEIETLPPFLNPGIPITLTALERTADTLMKYEQVDTLSDKLAYLADGLNQIQDAAKPVETLTEPERTVLAGITTRWRGIIQKEIAAISGRAELRTELRTKQALFSERVGLVLRLENTGQAVAENVTVSLEPSDDYEVVSEATVGLARVSTKRPSDAEFTIHPKREDRVRLDFTITWDDREGRGKSRRFAGKVSFIEVEREFTRIPNPYVAGNPITSPKLFFGREDVFDFVLENLVGAEQKNTLVLHGQRRTGKSSVLLQLRDRVLPQEFIPVYINMEALPDVKTMEAFLARLAYEIGRAVRKRGLELEVPVDFSEQPATTFDRFMDAAEDTLSGQRLVVMFDEFELIESKIIQGMDAGVLNYFRNLMQYRDSLIFVFAGTHRLQEMTRDYWSILFSIALNREIGFLGEEDTRRLITKPVQDHLEYDDLAIEKIIRVTHRQPYLVQLICWQLVNYLNDQQRNYATINDVDEVLAQTLVTAEAYFNSIWEQSTSHQRLALALFTALIRPGKETATLSEIQTGLADKGVAITGHELIAALHELCRRDVLEERTNGELYYRFQIDLVRMWVEKNKPLSRVLIEEGL